MIKIRLSRGGAKNSPRYRIVAIEESVKQGGQPLEILGYWDSRKNIKSLDKKKIQSWADLGAIITKSVRKLI